METIALGLIYSLGAVLSVTFVIGVLWGKLWNNKWSLYNNVGVFLTTIFSAILVGFLVIAWCGSNNNSLTSDSISKLFYPTYGFDSAREAFKTLSEDSSGYIQQNAVETLGSYDGSTPPLPKAFERDGASTFETTDDYGHTNGRRLIAQTVMDKAAKIPSFKFIDPEDPAFFFLKFLRIPTSAALSDRAVNEYEKETLSSGNEKSKHHFADSTSSGQQIDPLIQRTLIDCADSYATAATKMISQFKTLHMILGILLIIIPLVLMIIVARASYIDIKNRP